MGKKQIESKVIVITGGTSGLGKTLADYFRARGERVAVLARSCKDGDGEYPCDVTNPGRVKEVMGAICAEYGRIDVLINNAGAGITGAMELLSNDGTRQNMDVNFFGSLYCSKYALPYMKRGARIINISSVCALFALPYRAMYCASKAAVNMLSYGMRMELHRSGVQVSSVCPGEIKTKFMANRKKEMQTNERYGDRIQRAAEELDAREVKRMPEKVIIKPVSKLVYKKRAKPLVIVGGKYKFFYFAQKILPTSWFLKICEKVFG